LKLPRGRKFDANFSMEGDMGSQHIGLTETLDQAPLGRIHLLVAALCGVTFGIDGFDTAMVGALARNIAKDFMLSRLQLGELLSITITGMVLGYLFVSPLASRIGQKKLMVLSTASFGVLSMLTLFAQGFHSLLLLRLATGVFLGAALPGTIALTAEYSPRRWRATFITYMGLGMSIGLISASLTTAALLQWHGWRGVMLVAGMLPVVHSIVLAVWLPESMFYLARRRKFDQASRILAKVVPSLSLDRASFAYVFDIGSQPSGAISGLFREQRLAGTFAIWLAFFNNLMVNYFIQSWLPTILIDIGASQRTALLMNAVAMSASFLAGITTGPLMDRFGIYRVVCAMFLGGATFVAIAGVSVSISVTLVVCATFVAFYFNTAAQKGTGAICAFFYPPELRATGYGWGSGIGRIGAAIGPILIGQMMALHWSSQMLFYVASLPMLIGSIAIFALQKYVARRDQNNLSFAMQEQTAVK
jgi:AAHS family 4-hydroxybenzoate transporter-like MFS transporter